MANPNPDANSKRRADLTAADIRNRAKILEDMAIALRATADALKHKGVNSVRVDGVTKFDRGVDLLGEFDGHVMLAIAKAKPAVKK